MSTTFAARLNRLFDTVYPPGRGPHTSAEVIAALKAEGITMSAPYLSQLRSGNRTNPSGATMAALANFFRIKAAYFTDDEYYEKLDKELQWLKQVPWVATGGNTACSRTANPPTPIPVS